MSQRFTRFLPACAVVAAMTAAPAFAQDDAVSEVPAGSATAYSLGFRFLDHDGTTRPVEEVAVMRTGAFVGAFTLVSEDGEQISSSLGYAWAWYYDGNILNQPDNNDFLWLHAPVAPLPSHLELSDEGKYEVTIPMGTRDYPDLPAASLTLRIWLGLKDELQFDGKQEPTGAVAVLDVPVNVVETPFAIWVESPRNNAVDSVLGATVVTAYPVQEDTYFDLTGGGTATPLVSMVMISAGETSSKPFGVQIGSHRGPGRIVATRVGDQVAIPSSEIDGGSLGRNHQCPECGGTGSHPEIHMTYIWWELCIKPGSPGGFGSGPKEECGNCAETPSTPALCNHGPNDDVYPDQNQPDCEGVTLWWDCEIFKRWVPAAKYRVTNVVTISRGCSQGSTSGTTNSSSETSIGLNGQVSTPGNGTVGANGSHRWHNGASTATNMNTAHQRICCTLVYAGQGNTYILDCRDVD